MPAPRTALLTVALALACACSDDTSPATGTDTVTDTDTDTATDAGVSTDTPTDTPVSADTATDTETSAVTATLGKHVQLIPGANLPAESTANHSNNNLDVAVHDGRTFLAWRTGPNHFASEHTRLHVVSTAKIPDNGEPQWRYEGTFFMATDLREPRFLAWKGKLWLFFAVLGKQMSSFDPQGARVTRYEGPGKWSTPKELPLADFIPWRARIVDGKPYLIGYTGGSDIYAGGKLPDIRVQLLTSDDGESWKSAVGPAAKGQQEGEVLQGGVSETDFAILDDGSLVAVGRNEGGDKDGFGSKVCTAPAGDWGKWTCTPDPKKYDSPLVFRHSGRVWLIGRRQVANDGLFDLGKDDLSHEEKYVQYQANYWGTPKRCSLWRVDPAARKVHFHADLPSDGDTCFASVLPRADGGLDVYNYTSPVDTTERSWIQGQNGDTLIYRLALHFQ